MLTYKRATERDIQPIMAFCKEQIDRYEDVTALDYLQVLHVIEEGVQRSICQYESIWDGSNKVGYRRLYVEGGQFFLGDLYIFEAYRRAGIGTLVVRDVIHRATALRLPLVLYVLRQNTQAVALYRRLGFVVEEVVGTRYKMIWRQN